jgi:hypothetical protein
VAVYSKRTYACEREGERERKRERGAHAAYTHTKGGAMTEGEEVREGQ